MASSLLLVGASVRAAAVSAQTAGYQVHAIDMFNDRDLTQIAECRLSLDYPQDLPRLSQEFPKMPFLYTGALENYPEILLELSSHHKLLGMGSDSLATLRNPFWLANFLESESLPAIELKPYDSPPRISEEWLVKPFCSGHGLNIQSAAGHAATTDSYYQKFTAGLSVGGLFLGDGNSCQLIGCHQQFTGLQSEHSAPHLFSGAFAPLALPDTAIERINSIGTRLTRKTGLRGLFGCDFIVSDEIPYLLEVNPRYTAATELWEQLLDDSLIFEHCSAWNSQFILPEFSRSVVGTCLKIILYTPTTTCVPEEIETSIAHIDGVRLVDIPHAGTVLDQGAPFCSLIIRAVNTPSLLNKLRQSVEEVSLSCNWRPQGPDSLSRIISTQIERNIA